MDHLFNFKIRLKLSKLRSWHSGLNSRTWDEILRGAWFKSHSDTVYILLQVNCTAMRFRWKTMILKSLSENYNDIIFLVNRSYRFNLSELYFGKSHPEVKEFNVQKANSRNLSLEPN